MRKVFASVLIASVLFSCTRYSQIYQVAPTSPIGIENDLYTFENDTVKIVYSFWNEYGTLSYSFYNKLDVPIYIDWKKCSFIRNGEKIDYWVEEVNTKIVSKTRGYGISNYNWLYPGTIGNWNLNNSITLTNSNAIKPTRVIFIAPRSAVTNIKFKLQLMPIASLTGKKISVKLPGANNSTQVRFIDYTINNSPLFFRNFISISLSEDFLREKYIDNGFYVEKVIQLPTKKFKIPNPNYQTGQMRYKYPLANSKWFYINLPE